MIPKNIVFLLLNDYKVSIIMGFNRPKNEREEKKTNLKSPNAYLNIYKIMFIF